MSKASPAPAAGAAPGPDDYQAHSDLRTLIEAHKIHKDKTRHGAAMKKHKEMLAALQAIAAQQQQQQQQPQPAPDQGGAPAQPAGPSANGGAF